MDPLLRQALVGTRRAGTLAPTHTAADALSTAEDPAWRLLQRAGALDLLRRAAAPALQLTVPPGPPADERPCPPALRPVFAQLLAGENPELLPEALKLLAEVGGVLPPALLPQALGLEQHRALLAPVLGHRGRWLATQNPAWAHWVAPEAALEERWRAGRPEERVLALGALRQRDPALGLRWLEAVWPSEKAETRALLLVGLVDALGPADEAFLERALDDRGARVRERARALLRRIPGAALGRRVAARLDGVITRGAGRLRRAGPRLHIGAAPPLDEALIRDGISEAGEQGLPPESARLASMLAAVPLRHWCDSLGGTPAEILLELPTERWDIAEGFSHAACDQPEGAWIRALMDFWRRGHRGAARLRAEHWLDELTRHLPAPAAAELARELLAAPSAAEAGRLSTALELLPEWPEPLALAWLDTLRRGLPGLAALGAGELLWWELSIADAPRKLPRSCLALAALPVPEGLGVRRWRISLEAFAVAVERRRQIVSELRP